VDQILHAHLMPFETENCINGLDCNIVFDMSGGFSPISIKDQVIRASLIVERAIERKLITEAGETNTHSRPLLVVGGGIAGVAACYHASQRNIVSFLVEKNDSPLAKYRSYGDRLIVPNQYDWPFNQWNREEFPFSESDEIFVNLKEFNMSGIIERFSRYWRDAVKTGLTFLHSKNEIKGIELLKPANEKEHFATAQITLKNPKELPDFGMILICTGFGSEKTFIEEHSKSLSPNKKKFMGMPFWNLNTSNVKRITAAGAKKAIICGGGDGSLQDFLLFVTGQSSVKKIYRQLPDSIKQFESEILEAENSAHRSELWLGNRNDDRDTKICLSRRSHAIYQELHQAHQKVIDKLMLEPKIWADIKTPLRKMTAPFFEDFGNRITLAYPCDHFSKCYAFNRFLTLLIAAYIEKEEDWGKVLLPQTAVTDVTPLKPHSCKIEVFNEPEINEDVYRQKITAVTECFNEKHFVKYKETSCRGFNSDEMDLTDEPFSPVIVRFGINLEPLELSQLKKPYYSSQMLPYSIPSKKVV
jgi:hypothetical protein